MASSSGTRHLGGLVATFILQSTLSLAGSAQAAGITPEGKMPPPGQIYSLAGYPGALCNDGTPGVYYFRKGLPGSTTWLLYLEGGKECYSNANCEMEERKSPILTSSTGWAVPKPDGIISTSSRINPTFYGANVLQVHYCSSDYWSGAKAATAPFSPSTADTSWSFQGRAIALAALQDLTTRNSVTGFSQATSFVFAGSSAGGLGIVYLVNDLMPYVPVAARKLMIVDAGFSLGINGFDPHSPPTYMTTTDPTMPTTMAGMMLWNGHGDTGCASKATTEAAQIACYNTATLIDGGYIHITTMIGQSELDTDQLSQHNWSGTVTQDTAHMTYATEFADAMKAILQASGSGNSVFAPQHLEHTLMSSSSEFQTKEKFPGFVEEPTQAVSTFYNAPNSPVMLYGNAAGLP